MKSKLSTTEKAVSEVLGEMLLLVIVVLLSAILANYAGSFIPILKNTPTSKFVGYENGDNYTIILQAGDPVQIRDLVISVKYNVTTHPKLCQFIYNSSLSTDSKAVFTSGNLKAVLYDNDSNGYWNFGEMLFVPKNKSNRTVISLVFENDVISRLHFVG